MSSEKNDRFTVFVIALIFLVFAGVDFLAKFGLLGEKSVPRPFESVSFSQTAFQSGSLFRQYEEWEKQYFFNRKKWGKNMLSTRIRLGKREVNGVYLGRKGRYLPRHSAGDYAQQTVLESLGTVGRLVQEYDAKIMLIPTADEIWKQDLPAHADSFDQSDYLERVHNVAGEDAFVSLYEILKAHEREKIFYDTDPHWTSLAAYYGYQAWRVKSGMRIPYYYDPENTVTVTKHFLGEFSEKTELSMPEEELFVFQETLKKPVSVVYDGERESEGFYRTELLRGGHPVDYFLGNDFAFAEITTGRERKNSLFVIGDSYASCMIPLMAPHFEKIYFVNMEQFQGDLWNMMEQYREDENTMFLLLQSVTGFLDDFRENGSGGME